MKHLLFFLSLSLIFFSGTKELYADAIKPCIVVDGSYTPTKPLGGGYKTIKKCKNQTVRLTIKNCGTTYIDPSEFSNYQWQNTSAPTPFIYTFTEMPTSESGIWVVRVEYNDPIFGTTTPYYDTLEITQYPSPSITDADSLVIKNNSGGTGIYSHCKDDIMTFHATNTNYYLPNSYKWFSNANQYDTSTAIIGTGADLTRVISPSATYVNVIARDIHGCIQRAYINTPLKGTPIQPNLGADKYKCAGTSVKLSPYSPPQASYTYYWNSSATGTSDTTYTVTAPGKYWVTIEKFPTLPCKVADTIYVYDIPAPIFTLGNDTSICYQANGPLHAKSSSALTYTWTPGTYFPGGNTGANPLIDFYGVGLGTYSISVTGKDGNNCTSTKTQNVTHLGQGSNPYMFVTANPIDICNGSTGQFNTVATATYSTTLTYQWTPALHLNKDTAYRPMVDLTGETLGTPFNYSLKVSDATGCYLTITTSATLVPSVAANVNFSDTSICSGNHLTFQSSGTGGTGGLTYTWSPSTDLSDPAIPNPVATPTVAHTLYTVTVSDSKGCQDSKTIDLKSVIVMVNLIPTDTFGYSTEPMVLNPVVNSTTYHYQWTNVTTSTSLDTNKTQVAEATGTYAVYATDPASGCYASDTINVTIQVGNPRLIYVPNVVNPASANADNKTVKVYGTAVQENDFTFRIYNKWGEMIYETTSFTDANTNGWNGVYKTANGTEQNLSVYTYSLHGKYFDGKEFDKTGSITLMR